MGRKFHLYSIAIFASVILFTQMIPFAYAAGSTAREQAEEQTKKIQEEYIHPTGLRLAYLFLKIDKRFIIKNTHFKKIQR